MEHQPQFVIGTVTLDGAFVPQEVEAPAEQVPEETEEA
jgi:hypothetical protein